MRGACLLVLLLLAAQAGAEGQDIDRPWHESRWLRENPNIFDYGSGWGIWWNFEGFDDSLESLEVESMAELDIEDEAIAAKVISAEDEREEASYKKRHCRNGLEMIEGLRLGLVGGTAAITAWRFGGPWAALGSVVVVILSEAWNEIAPCMEYSGHWMASMDHSMSALEMSMDLASQKVDGLSTEYEKMAKAGLCHDNYHGPGRETCRNASSALATIGGGSREGDFGGYVFAQESMDGLDEDVWAPLPYMKNYSVAMVSLWGDNGAIEKFDSLTQQSILIMDAALLHYEMLEGDAERQMRVVDEKYSRLQAKELEKIDEAVASSAIGSSGPGTISERLLEIKAEKQLTEINIFDRAAAIYDAKGEDYIYLAMEGMEDALDEFSSLEMELAILEDDAIDVVEAQKDEAAELIASLESMMAAEPRGTALQQHLEKAKEKFEEGDEASTLGAKYEAYYDAAAEARSALSSGLDYEEEVAVDSTIAEIDALLQKAKADEIPVEAEEAELNLLKTQTGLPGRLEYLENIKDSIVANARMKYGHLDGMRADIMSRIMLAGENAADLITEMNEDEAGVEFRADGTLDYELSLGQLKKLKAAYLDIEGSLEAHLTEMVANSMAVSEFSFIEDVALDEPAKVTLDLLLSNRHEYSADNVAVKVDLPMALRMLYSDITEGAEDVVGVRTEDGDRTLVVVLEHVSAFETFNIVLEKQMIIAHTESMEKYVTGMGDGSAKVVEEIEFDLDVGVNSIRLPDYYDEASIDGFYYGRPLSSGSHMLEATYTVEDAYTEEIENIHAIQIGLNTEVSYDILLSPEMDIDKTIVYVDSFNDSRITDIDVYAVTGERTQNERQISQTSFVLEVLGLDEGVETRLKVTYDVEELEAFVNDQLALLDTGNYSEEVELILADAHSQANAGNYSEALERIEEAKAEIKKESKESKKVFSKYEKLKIEIDEELVQIDNGLARAEELGYEGPFVAKLTARKSELELRLQEAEGQGPLESLETLDEVNLKWMDSEVKSLMKEMYKDYNDLRERLVDAGDLSTPQEFLEFEAEMNKLEVGGRPEYVVNAAHYLEKVREIVEAQEGVRQSESDDLFGSFSSLKGRVLSVLDDYIKQKEAAKGTEFSGLFKYTESKVEKIVSDIEGMFGDEDNRLIILEMDELEDVKDDMSYVLSQLKKRAEDKLQLAASTLNYKKESLGAERTSDINRKIQTANELLASGEYVNALRAGEVILKELDGSEDGDNSLLILGITAVAILATIIVYIMQNQKEFGLKKEKKLKKLERFEKESP